MALLEITNLRKVYPSGEIALQGVDLAVGAREFVAILGLSGSGKSTLLRCINRLVEPSEGCVVLDGIEVTSLGKTQLRKARRSMGMIFQDFNLVDRLTVLENVLSGTLGTVHLFRAVARAFPREEVEHAINICARVGLIDQVQKRADQLSGGQRQRVGIARALMQKPKILLVDEPTSSLDPKIGIEVMDLMCELASETCIPLLVSVHDVQLARRYSDRIVGMQKGVKIFDEPTSTLDNHAIGQIYDMETELLDG